MAKVKGSTMRDNCVIDTKRIVLSKQTGRRIERGDIVFFRIDPKGNNAPAVGRVIGCVTARYLPYPYLCVARILGDTCCEHWVDPHLVTDHCAIDSYDKLQWLFGPKFLETTPDSARQCFDLLVSQMETIK